MSLLTPANHHHRQQQLRLLWLEASSIYGILTPQEQWDLHELYRPSEHVTEAELTEHLAALRQTKPSLVNKVGKTYRLIERVHQTLLKYNVPLSDHEAISRAIRPFDKSYLTHLQQPPDIPARSNQPPKHIYLAPIMKPEIDVHQLSRALINLVEYKNQQNGDDSARDLAPGSEDDARAA